MSSNQYPASPDWVKDLIIYEINTKGFTSPNGPESGTFKSTEEKMAYLADLGINAIWLTGHSWSHPTHFYNIWTQYAVIEPDKIDPSLGTEQDFKDLIDTAHQHGIRVILELITHGVMSDSPLIDRHPDWFKGESWGMIDYDFGSRNPQLDQWWVDVWSRYVTEFGIDGFRLDLGMRRPELWQRVRDKAREHGREIVLINETEYDKAKEWCETSGMTDVAPIEDFIKQIDFVQRDRYTVLDVHHKIDTEINYEYGRADTWGIPQWENWIDYAILGKMTPDMAPKWAWSSVQLSCHDDGWEDFEGDNPFVAQSSRFRFGYGVLFSGMVPIMMAGEEFDAQYKPLPTLSPNLFGGANPGQGTWLYGSMLQWDNLEEEAHRQMLADVKKLIAIRKQEGDLLAAKPNYTPKQIKRLPFQSNHPTVSPYMRWNDDSKIVVIGNIHDDEDIEVTLNIADLDISSPYRVTDLWTQASQESSDDTLRVRVKRDKTSGGGVALLKIQSL